MNVDTRIRGIVIAGVFASISILLGITRLGFIPVPTPAGNATIMHVPAILGGILEGPIVGSIIGLGFGIFSFSQATIPMFKDPLVAILPRIFVGVVAWLAYAGLKRLNVMAALVVSAVAGTLTNTVLVLGMAAIRGYLSPAAALAIGVTHGLPEIVVAVIIVVAVMMAWRGVEGRSRKTHSDL